MKRECIGIEGLAALALFAAATCRTTRTIVAKVVTPTATPVAAPQSPAIASPRTPPTPLPVVTAAAPSIYDRTPGVLYEQPASEKTGGKQRPTAPLPAQTPVGASAPAAAATLAPTKGSPTPTHKPGAYYEPADYRPTATGTPTPEKRP